MDLNIELIGRLIQKNAELELAIKNEKETLKRVKQDFKSSALKKDVEAVKKDIILAMKKGKQLQWKSKKHGLLLSRVPKKIKREPKSIPYSDAFFALTTQCNFDEEKSRQVIENMQKFITTQQEKKFKEIAMKDETGVKMFDLEIIHEDPNQTFAPDIIINEESKSQVSNMGDELRGNREGRNNNQEDDEEDEEE